RLRSGFGEPDVTGLARADQLGHGPDAVLDRYLRVHAVELVQVDVVHAEALQARFAGVEDVGRAAVDPTDADDPADAAVLQAPHDAALRRQDHPVAPTANRSSDQLLVGERTIHVRRVEERHAEVERAMNGRNRFRLVARSVELAHAHASEADG